MLGPFDFLVTKSVPLGLGYLAAYLMERNCSVKIIDEEVKKITPENIKDITDNDEQLFGISCMTPNVGRGYELANLIKSAYPKSTIIFGGIHPTVAPDEVISKPSIDLVVRGEAEPVIEQIVTSHKKGFGFKDILSCSYKDSGKIVHKPMAPLIDINLLPDIPYHLFDSKIYDMGFIISSRGCPYNCAFCGAHSVHGRRARHRSVDNVIEELKLLKNKYNARGIYFQDSTFLIDKKYVIELFNRMIDERLNLVWACNTRVNTVDESILKLMKRAGCWMIVYGIESGNQKSLDLMRKGVTVEQNERAVRLTEKAGITAFSQQQAQFQGQFDPVNLPRLKEAQLLMLQGKSLDEAATQIGIPPQTLLLWQHQFRDFSG